MVDQFRLQKQQGWRGKIPATKSDTLQLTEMEAAKPSVISVSCLVGAGVVIDDQGTLTVQTRVQEALRTRVFRLRNQGFAANVPAGITRVFVDGAFFSEVNVYVLLSEGVVTTESMGNSFEILAGLTNSQVTPAYARTVTVKVLTGSVRVLVKGGGFVTLTVGGVEEVTIAAYATTEITEATGVNAASVSVVWEVTA